MRLTSDLEMPLVPPRASTRASTLRVEMPGVSLHHHGVEGLVDPAARLEPVREEAALPELLLGRSLRLVDGPGQVSHLGGVHPLAVAVAVVGTFVRAALVELGANGSAHPGFQQVLEPPAHDLRNQGAIGGALHELSQLGGVTMGEGYGLCSVWW